MLKAIEKLGIHGVGFLIAMLIVILFVASYISPVFLANVFGVLILVSPIWLPIFLAYIFWEFWVIYVRSNFIHNQKHVLLEIRLPREITKSPLAMEAVLAGLHQGAGEATPLDMYWFGKTRPWFSLEIASIEGNVRFFVWTREFYKNIVEAQIYAQYPEVEIYEVEDYTRFVEFDLDKTSVWGCDFFLTKPDPYPIKTYIDYGLDKDPKEEHKVDPLASVIEYMGQIGKGEQVWIQILARINKDEKKKKGTWFGKSGWKDEAQELVDKLIMRDPKTKITTAVSSAGFPVEPRISEGEKDITKAIERSITKLGFDCGIRGIYLADSDKFNPTNIVGLIGTVKQFNSNTLNKFAPTRGLIGFDYPWQDYKGKLQDRARRIIFDAYRRRSYFHHPYKRPPFVLNTEELATLYHLPGETVQTPTIERMSSKKSEAPANLPV